tara:strand:+ start:1756 stop:3648 length:1893 start_codon:yes stop_codon:yes gene_type:complete
MSEILIPSDPKDAMNVVCLYMAQAGDPEKFLGYFTQTEALDDLAEIFDVPRRTFKGERDYFDSFTNSGRQGYKTEDVPRRLKHIFEEYNHLGKAKLLEISRKVLCGLVPVKSFTYLPDLKECKKQSHSNIAKVDVNKVFEPSNTIMRGIINSYKKVNSNDSVSIVGSALVISTPTNLTATISTQEFPRCWSVRPYVLAIERYVEKLDQLKILLIKDGFNASNIKDNLKKLPSHTWKTDLDFDIVNAIDNNIKENLDLGDTDKDYFYKLMTDKSWSSVKKELSRADWDKAAIKNVGQWLDAASDRRPELSMAIVQTNSFVRLMQNSHKIWHFGGENRIYYGAPGTGKSYKIDGIIKGQIYTRTVFHPDLQNSDFFGCLKPRMQGINVNYEFVPGPFIKALSEAYLNPSKPVYLVIEELNRAPAATVFGDLFLLLDRDDDGKGIYDVDFPSPESCEWFNNKTGETDEKIFIPSNLFIYASMNSADQGVFPIDTAFRRRWQQEYLPLDYDNGPIGEISYLDEDNIRKIIKWESFVETLNNYLTSIDDLSIAEDRLLGQWFVKSKELDGKGIPEKILLYLWDDLLRHVGRNNIFDERKIKTYGALTKAVEGHKHFLSKPFIEELNKKTDSHGEV